MNDETKYIIAPSSNGFSNLFFRSPFTTLAVHQTFLDLNETVAHTCKIVHTRTYTRTSQPRREGPPGQKKVVELEEKKVSLRSINITWHAVSLLTARS